MAVNICVHDVPQAVLTHTLSNGLPESGGGWTPLLLACEEGHLEIVTEMLTHAKSNVATLLETTSTEVNSLCLCLRNVAPSCLLIAALHVPSRRWHAF